MDIWFITWSTWFCNDNLFYNGYGILVMVMDIWFIIWSTWFCNDKLIHLDDLSSLNLGKKPIHNIQVESLGHPVGVLPS